MTAVVALTMATTEHEITARETTKCNLRDSEDSISTVTVGFLYREPRYRSLERFRKEVALMEKTA